MWGNQVTLNAVSLVVSLWILPFASREADRYEFLLFTIRSGNNFLFQTFRNKTRTFIEKNCLSWFVMFYRPLKENTIKKAFYFRLEETLPASIFSSRRELVLNECLQVFKKCQDNYRKHVNSLN